MSERQDFEGQCAECKRLFFPMHCIEHHILALANKLQQDRITALEGALRAMVRASAQPGVLLVGRSNETMHTAITIAITTMPELKDAITGA